MRMTIQLGLETYEVHTSLGLSAAIEQTFDQAQPNHFSAEFATKTPMKVSNFIGDTEQGGSCNVNILRFNPHCNGTHTESIQHICDASSALSLAISEISPPPLMPCVLVSVTPIAGGLTDEAYAPPIQPIDRVITRQQLTALLAHHSNEQLQSLAIRTLPNSTTKQSDVYDQHHQPPFLTHDAVLYLNERGVEHLLVDVPSIDRLHDDGLLSCHHYFWQVIQGQSQPTTGSLIHKTITEMAYFGDDIPDGFYFINLQLTAFKNDASPSKPMFYSALRIN